MRSLRRKCVRCGRQSRGSRGTKRRSVTCQRKSGRKRASLAVSEGPGRATGLHVAGEEEMENLVGCRCGKIALERADAATDRAREEYRG